MADELISLNEATDRGISKLRMTQWTNPHDHISLDLFPDGTHGPWVSLWSPANELCGNKNPHKMIMMSFDWDCKEWLPWTDPEESQRDQDTQA